LEKTDLSCLGIIVLVEEHVEFADGFSAAHELLLDEVGVLGVEGEDLGHQARGDHCHDALPVDRIRIKQLEDAVWVEL